MHKSQANRAVLKVRATSRPARPTSTAIYTGPLTNTKAPVGPVRRAPKVRLTEMQRNSEGRKSEWSMSTEPPYGGWR